MNRYSPLAVLLLGALPWAQSTPGGGGSSTIYFSTDFVELADSGMGATSGVPGNQAATFDDEELLMVAPEFGGSYFATSCFGRAAELAWFGDNDGDGDYSESIIGDLDAIYLPDSAPNPPSIFDFYVSFRFYTFSDGVLASGGSAIQDGDLVRLLPGGGFEMFISENQIGQAMNKVTLSIDVNAFTVDSATGDLYWSMTSDQDVNGVTVNDGGIVRLRAANYTANPDGSVSSVTQGGAEIVMLESEVDAMFLNAGLLNAFDVAGLEIDPSGGSFVSSSTGLSLPNLWLVDEQSANGPAILSTADGLGAIASEGGVPFDSGGALGLSATGFSGFPTRNLTALEYRAVPLPALPLVLDAFPTSVTAPGTFTLDVGAATPGGFTLIFMNFAGVGAVPGGFTPRTPTALVPSLDLPGAYPELYTDANDGLLLFFASSLVSIDAQGYGTFQIPVPALLPGLPEIALSFQAYDVQSRVISTPVILNLE